MRFITAAVVLLGMATASAEGFRITELTSFSGILPCADCVAIRYVLTLRPDGLFYRQRSYMRSEASGQRVLEFGSWTVSGSVLTLTSTARETEAFDVSSLSALQALDRDGKRIACPDAADGNCVLAREPRAQVPTGSYRVRGIYKEAGGHRSIQPCGTSVQLPAETSGRTQLLQKLAQATAGGKPALVTVTGTFDRSGGPGSEVLRIANVLTVTAGAACPAALPVSAMPHAPASSPNSATQPNGAAAGLLVVNSWVLTELNHVSPPAGVGEAEASIRFMQDRRVAGFTGCNRFSGAYTLGGRSIRVGPVVATRMACPPSANIEALYVKALESARKIDIQGNALELLDDAGRRIARFRAVAYR